MKVTFPTRPRRGRGWIDVTLRYESADPFAVAFVFPMMRRRFVVWVVDRELLRDGLSRMVGEGDIRITPGPSSIGVRLSSPAGKSLLVFARDDIEMFLRTTYLAVPEGTEHKHFDLSELDQLLLEGS